MGPAPNSLGSLVPMHLYRHGLLKRDIPGKICKGQLFGRHMHVNASNEGSIHMSQYQPDNHMSRCEQEAQDFFWLTKEITAVAHLA